MKILHSKSTSEPILLASACHNMNLVAVVTASAAVIYRATTLTVVVSLPLKQEAIRSTSGVHACWSPSGRLFTLALPSGVVLLLDVEDGVLVRRLVPACACDTAESGVPRGDAEVSSLHDPQHARASDDDGEGKRAAEEEGGTNGGGGAGGGDDDDEEEEEAARKLSCAQALAAAPSLPISIPAAPVVGMTWAVVAPDSPSQHVSSSEKECLPLQSTLSQPLLNEMQCAAPAAATTLSPPPFSVSLLTIIGADGRVSVVAGGLQEVMCSAVKGLVDGVGAVDQFVVAACGTAADTASDALTAGLGFHALTAKTLSAFISANAKRTEGAVVLSPPPPLQNRRHCGYVVARNRDEEGHRLLQIGFHGCLAALTAPHVPVLCRIAEYCRVARCCLENAHAKWRDLLQGRTRPHLRLPECAKLLYKAVVEAIALPDERELRAYYARLDRNALADDLDRISLVVSVLANDMYSICYRAYDLSLSLATGLSGMRYTATASPAMAYILDALCHQLAEERRSCETFLLNIRREGMDETNMIAFALQRASLMFDLPSGGGAAAGAGGVDAAGNPIPPNMAFSYGAEPLPTIRHPSLLAALERIRDGKVVDASGLSSAVARSEAMFHARQQELHALLRQALATSSLQMGPGTTGLACRLFPLHEAAEEHHAVCRWHLDVEERTRHTDAQAAGDAPHEQGTALLVHAVKASSASAIASAPVEVGEADVLAHGAFSSLLPGADPVLRAALPASAQLLWYGRLAPDQHILLYAAREEASNGAATAADGFTLVAVDDEGNARVRETDDEDSEGGTGSGTGEDAAEEEGAARSALDKEREGAEAVVDSQAAEGLMVLTVRGMEMRPGSWMASMSKGRQFCVVAASNRFVVVDLFDE